MADQASNKNKSKNKLDYFKHGTLNDKDWASSESESALKLPNQSKKRK